MKFLRFKLNSSNGKNNLGRIVSFHRGGMTKRYYKCLDFNRVYDYVPAVVRQFEYDSNRNASIALICYYNEVITYILALKNLKIGSLIYSGSRIEVEDLKIIGNVTHLGMFPSGVFLSNIELRPGFGGKYARSGGSKLQLLKKYNDKYTLVKLPTGEQRFFLNSCRATVGVPINFFKNYSRVDFVKAGLARHFGRRPVVRGVAMNPIDHPHGGAGGRVDRSPWGWLTKGPKTAHFRNRKYIYKSRKV